ncbi:hypothetical protein GCM10027036_34360 [Flavihumibacter cheonanensis]|uniref:hypothetical protein n=1 Tax=Flavihumibacter cheonanensis TaxID=1442385 RepID=UPI001EF90BF3|nr:hypothetical protein [Flavihumibacter cheonanensis]MCG7754817.1 hypothetical protein [Flavihumibacter cheonanensis]
MTRLLFFAIILSTFSCKTNTKNSDTSTKEIKVFKQFDYRITIDIWNGFFGHGSKFILNNSLIDNYDSTDAKIPLAKPLTLYYISFHSKKDSKTQSTSTLVPVDTTEIAFSKDLSDTLFLLTKDFLKSIKFNNYDTVGQLTPVITDDSHGLVELNYGGRKLSATISSIHNPTIATKELDTLLNFVYKFRPAKKD